MPRALACLAAALLPLALHAQPAEGWQACAAMSDAAQRLACFDRWAQSQQPAPAALASPAAAPAPAAAPSAAASAPPPPVPAAVAHEDNREGCHDPALSELTRMWELDAAASCGTFGIRSYRPISLSAITSDSVNRQPGSENPANNAPTVQPYRTTETRIQLSVRSKLAEGLLARDGPLRDSLWFGYTQQSYWQLFTGALSRPFRNTDHEPEVVYAYPFALAPLAGWQLRYGGIGLVHQSNGQSLPLSRSWNRVYLMAGAEHAGGYTLQARVWQRIHEDPATDDNPHISTYIGRAEFTGGWTTEAGTRVQLTWRNNLRDLRHGSVRAEWLAPLDWRGGSRFGSLRLHTQLFTGYGDSLIDFNRRRTVFSIGLSLVDW